MYRLVQEGTNRYGQFNENRLTREQAERVERYKEAQANYRAQLGADTSVRTAGITAEASKYGSRMEFQLRRAAAYDNVFADLTRTAAFDPRYQAAVEGPGGLAAGQQYLRDEARAIVDRQFGPGPGGGVIDLGNFR
jgi:hypothetical protein